jgi:hypothetical protein
MCQKAPISSNQQDKRRQHQIQLNIASRSTSLRFQQVKNAAHEEERLQQPSEEKNIGEKGI